jgi:hypothetical protein
MNQDDVARVFQDVVLCGLACGLQTPQEWIRNYAMHEAQAVAYSDIPVVDQLVQEVAERLYCAVHHAERVEVDQLADWISQP